MTDKKSEVRQKRRWRKSFEKRNLKAVLKIFRILETLVTSAINLRPLPTFFCVQIYFSNEKLTEIYQVKSK